VYERRHDLIAVAILALIATVLFADVLFGINNFYMRDLTRYYYPTKQALREVVMNGEFPYWNRYFSAGQPIAANPEHEVFYPLTWLILLPSYHVGYCLHILVHIYIGLIGMYALLRSMELRIPASFIGALSFGIGGLYLSYVNLLPILFCAAWLPLTCLYVRRFMLRPTLRDFALASLFLGLQFLVGEPTTVMQTGFLIGMYALYRGWYAARDHGEGIGAAVPEMLARVVFIALISIAAIAVGAAQMIPAVDHVGESARSRPFDFTLVSAWSLPWAKLAEVIYPNVLGHISIDRVMWYWGGGLYPGMGSPFLFSIYNGLLITALAIAGFFVRARGARFVLILILFSLALALGGHTPILRLMYDAGIATSIRYPEKFALIAIFAMILFASQMLDRMLEGDENVREAAMGFVLATAVVALVIGIVAFLPVYGQQFRRMWGLGQGGGADRMVAISRADWLIAAARGGVLMAILWFLPMARRRWKPAVLFAILGAFMVADLAPVVHQLNPRMPSHFFTKDPDVDAKLPKNRAAFRVFHESDWYGQEEIARKYFSTGDAVYWIVRNGLFPMTPAGHRVRTVIERDYDKTALVPTIDFTDSVWDVKRSGRTDWWQPFVAMSNAWYRGVYRNFEAEKKRVNGNMKAASPIDFQPLEQNPRYYFADQVVTIRDRRDFVAKLSKESFSRHVAFVAEPSFVPARGTVRGYRETANTAAIDVESSGGDSFLVMSVTPHKYWTVTIDGRAVKPSITNIGYQGIRVPAGRHRVEMRYRNTLVDLGMMISAGASVLLLAIAILASRRHAR
jgi:Bacterial membrane protein YfhO